MSKNFVKTTEGKVETYSIMFDYGTQKIDVRKDNKIVLDFVHGGFENIFSREGNDLIIGDDIYFYMGDILGVGYGKEEWRISLNNDGNYSIEIKKYHWQGSSRGYSEIPAKIETKTMTQEELAEFAQNFELTLIEGENTIYTTWPVLPNPNITYHMNDCGHYSPANGKLILKNYFKYENDEIYVGDRLLSDIIRNTNNVDFTKRIFINNTHVIYDSFLSENIKGKDCPEVIYSYKGSDTIEAGGGNDKIFLKDGSKKIVISRDDGRDTIYNKGSDSINLSFDTDDISYEKSGNNLIINRKYNYDRKQTVIYNFFKTPGLYNQLTITNGDTVISDNLLQDLEQGNKKISYDTYNKTKIKGSDLSDEMYSFWDDETFSLGKGHDVIHFKSGNSGFLGSYFSSFGWDSVNINEDSKLTLDFDIENAEFSYAKDGADAIINVTHKVTLHVPDYRWGIAFDDNSVYRDYIIVDPIIWRPPTREIVVDMFVGSVRLKDYFKYNNNNIYIGNTSLQELLGSAEGISLIDESESKKSKKIFDTFLNDTITASRYSDKITSSYGDDTIEAGRGSDILYLGEGNKTVNINKGDGKDTINISSDNTSSDIIFDDEVTEVSLKKSSNNLIIYRKYGNKTETTIINKFYKNNSDNDIKIKIGDNVIWDNKNNPETGLIYTAFDNQNINLINQNMCLWQADNSTGYVFNDDMTNYNQEPVLVMQN